MEPGAKELLADKRVSLPTHGMNLASYRVEEPGRRKSRRKEATDEKGTSTDAYKKRLLV